MEFDRVENMVLRKIFGPKRKEETGDNYIIRNFIMYSLHQIILC
jgi:hypothetical protein